MRLEPMCGQKGRAMNELERLRAKIAAIDKRLVRLLEQRLEVARHLATVKRDMGLELKDPVQEQVVLSRVKGEVRRPENLAYILRVFEQVIDQTLRAELDHET